MNISSFVRKTLAVAYGSAIAAPILWSIFGTTKAAPDKSVDTPKVKEHADLVLMKGVRAVNADASTSMLSPYFSFSLDEPIPCLLVRSMKEKSEPTSPADAQVWSQVISNQSTECDFSVRVRQLTLPVYEKIASTGALPAQLFTFEVFESSRDRWVSVGLFDHEAVCNSLQQEGMSQGIGTKLCVPWKPRF